MFPRTVEFAFARFQVQRDPAALAVVLDRMAPELLRVARHVASPEASAEDLVQATFLQAIEAAATHRRGQRALPWLLGILANQARHARRRARRSTDPARLRGEGVADPAADAAAREPGCLEGTVPTRLGEKPEKPTTASVAGVTCSVPRRISFTPLASWNTHCRSLTDVPGTAVWLNTPTPNQVT